MNILNIVEDPALQTMIEWSMIGSTSAYLSYNTATLTQASTNRFELNTGKILQF